MKWQFLERMLDDNKIYLSSNILEEVHFILVQRMRTWEIYLLQYETETELMTQILKYTYCPVCSLCLLIWDRAQLWLSIDYSMSNTLNFNWNSDLFQPMLDDDKW